MVHRRSRGEIAIEDLQMFLSGELFISLVGQGRHAAFWRILQSQAEVIIVDTVLHFNKNFIQLNTFFLFLLQFLLESNSATTDIIFVFLFSDGTYSRGTAHQGLRLLLLLGPEIWFGLAAYRGGDLR